VTKYILSFYLFIKILIYQEEKYEFAYLKHQKKGRVKTLILSQKGAIDKFLANYKNFESENMEEFMVGEQITNKIELDDNEIQEEEEVGEKSIINLSENQKILREWNNILEHI